MQTYFYLKKRKVLFKKTANIQNPTVKISMSIWFSLSSASKKIIIDIFNQTQILQIHNYYSDLIAIMTPEKWVGTTPASVTFCLPILSFK